MVAAPFSAGWDWMVRRATLGSEPPPQGLADHPALELALGRQLDARDMRQCRRDIGIGYRRRIGIAGFEIRPDARP